MFDLKFGFLVKNCVYRQLGMSRIIKFDEKHQNTEENGFYCVFIKFDDSRHARLSIYAVFHEESDFEVKNMEIRRLDVKKEENRKLKNQYKPLYEKLKMCISRVLLFNMEFHCFHQIG